MKQCQVMNKSRFQVKQKGFTLVETIIVILIGGLILAGIASGVNKAMGGQRSNSEISHVQSMSTAVKKIYAGRATYNGLSNTVARQMNAVPGEFFGAAAGDITNRWGGTVTVAPVALSGINDAGFTMTVTNVPEFECKEVIPALDSVTLSVTVGGNSVKAVNASTDISSLATECAAGGGANTLVYTFTR
jgi:prepilin-type N-terminal cleavage/methylation domain-containing protein